MHFYTAVALLATSASASYAGLGHWPRHTAMHQERASSYCDGANPFSGRHITPDPFWVNNMNGVYKAFTSDGDTGNATKVQSIQQQASTFFWASNIKLLSKADDAINASRTTKQATGKNQVVGLVVYDIPNRDCSAGESSGELSIDNGGLDKYKNDYITPLKKKLASAPDVHFVLVVEPDALANALTSTAAGCVKAKPVYEEAIAYAIATLQLPNVALYLDAGNSGWLGKSVEQCKFPLCCANSYPFLNHLQMPTK